MKGCSFHFKQPILRKYLKRKFEENEKNKKILENLFDLPVRMFPYDAFKDILKNYDNEKMNNWLVKYFERTWFMRYDVSQTEISTEQITNNAIEIFNKTSKNTYEGKVWNIEGLKNHLKTLDDIHYSKVKITHDVPCSNRINQEEKEEKNEKKNFNLFTL